MARPAHAAPLPRAFTASVQAAAASLLERSSRLPVPLALDDGGPLCEIPHLDFDTWTAEHNDSLPDHPAVFSVGTLAAAPVLFDVRDDHNVRLRVPNTSVFLERFGNLLLHTEPGYTQAGGQLSAVYGQRSRVGLHTSLRALAEAWQAGSKEQQGQYHSEFSCARSKFCKGVVEFLRLPRHLSRSGVHSTNLLVGGEGSGLPFHRHQLTWQLQLVGRKVWHLVPPNTMAGELAEAVGPFLYPTSAWSTAMRGMPLGRRPLRCLQHPGQILYFPSNWWHATENVDSFVLAYGEKPKGLDPQANRLASRNDELAQQLRPFEEHESPNGWYDFLARYRSTKSMLAERQSRAIAKGGHATFESFEARLPIGRTLTTMRAAAKGRAGERGAPAEVLNDSIAFAHCAVAGGLRGWLERGQMARLLSQWKETARELSSRVCELQCAKDLP